MVRQSGADAEAQSPACAATAFLSTESRSPSQQNSNAPGETGHKSEASRTYFSKITTELILQS